MISPVSVSIVMDPTSRPRSLLVALVAILLVHCGHEESRQPIRLFQVSRTDIIDNLSLSGTLDSDKKIQLKSEVSGTVKSISKKEGDRVRKGDTILVIDPLQLNIRLERDRLALEKSRIQLLQAERNCKEAARLAGAGGMSANQLQDLTWLVDLARIKWNEDRSAVHETQYLLGKSAILAPMNGILTSLEAKAGEVIVSGTASLGGGTVLGTVADLDKMGVDVGVSELDFPYVHPGQSASVATEAEPTEMLRGHIISVSPEAKEMGEKNIRYFQARISLDTANPKIAPGINVSVKLQVLSLTRVLAVPSNLLQSSDATDRARYVWVLKNGTPQKTGLGLGRTNYLLTEIVSGLAEGDWISSDSVAGPSNHPPQSSGPKAAVVTAEALR